MFNLLDMDILASIMHNDQLNFPPFPYPGGPLFSPTNNDVRRLTRLTIDALDVAFYLCNRHLNGYGPAKLFDVVNQILPMAYVMNTSYWCFYTNQYQQCICVCSSFGLICPHKLHSSQHWIDMAPVERDNVNYFLGTTQEKLYPNTATVTVTPIIYDTLKAYDLEIDLTVRQIRAQRTGLVFLGENPARFLITARYLVTPPHLALQDRLVQFSPRPTSVATYCSYFEYLPSRSMYFGTCENAFQIFRTWTAALIGTPRIDHLPNHEHQPFYGPSFQTFVSHGLPHLKRPPSPNYISPEPFTFSVTGKGVRSPWSSFTISAQPGSTNSRQPNVSLGEPTTSSVGFRRYRPDLRQSSSRDNSTPDTFSRGSPTGSVRKSLWKSNAASGPRHGQSRNGRSSSDSSRTRMGSTGDDYTLIIPPLSSEQPPRFPPNSKTVSCQMRLNRDNSGVVPEEMNLLRENYDATFPVLPEPNQRGNGKSKVKRDHGDVENVVPSTSASATGYRWPLLPVVWENNEKLGDESTRGHKEGMARISPASDVIVVDEVDSDDYLGMVPDVFGSNTTEDQQQEVPIGSPPSVSPTSNGSESEDSTPIDHFKEHI